MLPLIKRGKYYFCPECGHLMSREKPSCPKCQLTFEGVIIEDKLRPPQDPAKLEEVEERYEKVRHQNFFWISVAVTIFLGTLAIVILFLLRRGG